MGEGQRCVVTVSSTLHPTAENHERRYWRAPFSRRKPHTARGGSPCTSQVGSTARHSTSTSTAWIAPSECVGARARCSTESQRTGRLCKGHDSRRGHLSCSVRIEVTTPMQALQCSRCGPQGALYRWLRTCRAVVVIMTEIECTILSLLAALFDLIPFLDRSCSGGLLGGAC